MSSGVCCDPYRRDQSAGWGIGIRGGAVCHIRAIFAGVRAKQRQAFSIQPLAFSLVLALQGQGFGGEGAGGCDGAGVFAAQGVMAGGGQRLLLASDALYFADQGLGDHLEQSSNFAVELISHLC